MKNILLVFIGGGIGSVLRHLISISMESFEATSFPIATFITNIAGCFVIGLVLGKVNLKEKMNLLLATGFCGGFTTFSTFAKESLFLLAQDQLSWAIIYIFASIIIGTLLVWIGYGMTFKNTAPSHRS